MLVMGLMMSGDFLPVLDLYERYSKDGEMFLTGAFGGVRIFVYPIKGAHPDDRSWRMYFATRQEGVDRDRARGTAVTKPAPTGWASVHERRQMRGKPSMAETMAAVGMQAPFYQAELGLQDDDSDDQ